MLKRLIHHFLERRHYWRYADFAELAELYASRMLRILAVSMVSVFIAIYLYQNGYHLAFIMGYFAAYFLLRALVTFPAAFLVARIGPKHATLISNFLYVPALIALTQLAEFGLPVLVFVAIFQACSVALYDIGYMVNFSKVKKDDHIGKEIGFMYIIERVTMSISPLIGGLIAYLFGPEWTMVFASVVFGLAAIPLLFTPEPTKIHQKISFRHFNWKYTAKGLLAHGAIGADFVASSSMWSLYVAIAIFGTTSNAVYAQIGALTSITILASLAFAQLYGRIIDRRKGGELLRFGVIGNSLIHLTRPFIGTPVGVVMVNVTNEASTTAYSMPFIKGMFGVADDLPGYRIVYLAMMTISSSLGAAIFSAIIAVLALYMNEIVSMQIGYIIVAVIVLLILRHGLPAITTRQFP